MNALASIGAREEVHTLFNQLLRRNLVPNSGIVAALVNTELFHGNYKQAEDLIIKYTDPSNSSDIASDYLYQFIFTKFFRSNDLETAMKWFNRICEDKKSFHLLNKESIRALISLCRKNYSLQNLEHIWQTIQQNPKLFQHISNQDIYVEMIKTYTKFSLYEKANELSNQALDETASIHPYLCGNLYTAKLANYLRWLQDRQQFLNVHQKDLIHKLIQSLIKAYNDNNIFQQSYWYVTLMKYYIFRDNNIEIAVEILKYLQKTHIQILNEQHYHPIMQFYLKDGDFNEVLEIFKKMMSNEVTASTLSHLWLIQALLKLDRMKGTNFNNSTNLLKAVYEMNGLQIQGNNESTNLKNSQTPKGQLYQNAEVLTNITMSYIVSKNDGDGENLLFNFLEQIKENTNEKITNTFKYPLYKNIYKYYMNRGNEVQAVALIENIFEDLRRTIMKYVSEKTAVRCYDESIPRYLEEHFQYFFNIKLEQFEAKKRSKNTLNELLELSKVVKDCQVQLTNHSQNNLVHALLKNGTSGFQEALSICEEYLTAGNWKLISVEKSKKYILKALMYYLSDHSDTSMLKGKYKLLLDYYAVKLENLNETFEPLKLTKIGLLMKTLDSYNRRFSENDAVSVQGLLDKEYEFFNPPSSKYDTFMIRQSTSNILTQRFNQYYKSKGKVEVFKLMDKFPLTIEYLLTSDSSKKRSDKFMDQINRRESPPISDVHETHKSRNERIIRVLKLIQEENHPEREHNTINY